MPGSFTPTSSCPKNKSILGAGVLRLTRGGTAPDLCHWRCRTVGFSWLFKTHSSVHVSAQRRLHEPLPTEINTHWTHVLQAFTNRIMADFTSNRQPHTNTEDKDKYTTEHIYHVCVLPRKYRHAHTCIYTQTLAQALPSYVFICLCCSIRQTCSAK